MKIAIISDTHDNLDRIRRAVGYLQQEPVEMIIHCGDFVAPFTIPPFQSLNLPFVSVYGNNDGEKKGLMEKISGFGGLICYPPLIQKIGNMTFLLCHEPIPDESIRQYFDDVDVYVYGHTHKHEEREFDGIKIINPGEACGWLTGKGTFVIFDTSTSACKLIDI